MLAIRRAARTAAVLAAASAFAAVLATPASAIVGGTRADATRAGIGSLQYFRDGHPDWATCSAHALRTDDEGWTDLLVTASQCVTVMPAPGAQRVRSMSDQGRQNYERFRKAAELAGRATAAPERADRPAAGLKSTPEDPATFRFVFNSANRFQGELVRVKQFVVPEDWAWGEKDARGNVWDLSLVQLEHPIRVEGAVVAPPLPWKPVAELGWGRTDADPSTWHGPLGPWLRQNDVRFTSHADCAGAGIGADEVCLAPARDGGGTCQGDAGGGGVQQVGGVDVLTVIASRGPEPHCGTVNVYSAVWAHGGWILDQARRLEPRVRLNTVDRAAVPAHIDFAAAE